MKFKNYSGFDGRHAFLSASKYHWLNYDDNKIIETFRNAEAVRRGTELHELAARCIIHGVKLQGSKKTLNRYVNDAIGFRMTPEQVLFFSENCFGTADAIAYRSGKLRIHDLKTGVSPTSMKQLEIYAALFMLDYNETPSSIELRIYQNDEVLVHEPELETIKEVISKIIRFDKLINLQKEDL